MGIRYDFLSRIKDEGRLAFLFNKIIKRLNITRIMSAPKTFEDLEKEYVAKMFYSTCLWEMYLQGVIDKLKSWMQTLEEYETEFSSSWKYYAASRRLSSIKEYGGDEGDYNEDGTIRVSGISNKELESYSVLGVLVFEDWRDIVQETELKDLAGLIAALQTDANFSLLDALKDCTEIDLPTYKQDKNGNMVQMTFAELALQKTIKGNSADDLSSVLLYACNEIQSIIRSIRNLDKCKDNRQELIDIKKRAENLYNFKI